MPYALCPLLAPHVTEKGYSFAICVSVGTCESWFNYFAPFPLNLVPLWEGRVTTIASLSNFWDSFQERKDGIIVTKFFRKILLVNCIL